MGTDLFVVRAVTATICFCTAMVVGIIGYLAITSTVIPDQLDRLASLFAGAIIGYLVKTGVDTTRAQPVVVENTSKDPVQTEAVDIVEKKR